VAVAIGMAGRNVGVAVDFSPCSKNALRWAAANLAAPGDRLILIHAKASYQYEEGVAHLWERDGSRTTFFPRLFPPSPVCLYAC
jgi:hypothetical protein